MGINIPPSQDNTPDSRSEPDHQQSNSNPTDQGSPDDINALITNIQVHSSDGVLPLSPATKIGTSPEVQEQSPVVRPTANPPRPARFSCPGDELKQVPYTKRRQCSNPQIKQLRCAWMAGHIGKRFTAPDVKNWKVQFDIRKGDGTKYKIGGEATFLSNSYIRKKNKTNKNSVWLDRRFNKELCMFQYWFTD